MNATAIRWTEQTWNPASGCVKVTAGCKHCYAETLAENKRGTPAFPNGFELTLRPHKLQEPYRLKQPSMVFVNSMSDLFWDQIDDGYRDKVLDVIEATPQHEYQVLTKRAENLLRYSKRRPLPPNFWAGVTAENQELLDARGAVLRQVKAEIRFLSLEPALEDMNLAPLVAGRDNQIGGDGIQWVIWGGESGNHLLKADEREKRGVVDPGPGGGWVPRPDRMDWARHARDGSVSNGVAFFFKQWGGPRSTSGGKLLDGRTWEEFPRLPKGVQRQVGLAIAG
jgi:protein gp37